MNIPEQTINPADGYVEVNIRDGKYNTGDNTGDNTGNNVNYNNNCCTSTYYCLSPSYNIFSFINGIIGREEER